MFIGCRSRLSHLGERCRGTQIFASAAAGGRHRCCHARPARSRHNGRLAGVAAVVGAGAAAPRGSPAGRAGADARPGTGAAGGAVVRRARAPPAAGVIVPRGGVAAGSGGRSVVGGRRGAGAFCCRFPTRDSSGGRGVPPQGVDRRWVRQRRRAATADAMTDPIDLQSIKNQREIEVDAAVGVSTFAYRAYRLHVAAPAFYSRSKTRLRCVLAQLYKRTVFSLSASCQAQWCHCHSHSGPQNSLAATTASLASTRAC